ncbi:MAG: hypothetical protein Satyrvirus12_8 [Satyrvirus sp.]|uniref:Uncharacterized protein n=1 Tax=Satyrvirus sp. TaxID=2487771 RepID=A0A3G5AFJ2_9VIRU|nr:MAG: hypothetical protein Satyrvirus12_8 [Satyrvirus sp.]
MDTDKQKLSTPSFSFSEILRISKTKRQMLVHYMYEYNDIYICIHFIENFAEEFY